ncbi:fish-egg lectin-like [Ambystoma mexicanum]|uniref:fish-egg lectin-like n=1 Tax=Ambystoma mexicanum TaxID=8296 RepID=UPI0037E857DB
MRGALLLLLLPLAGRCTVTVLNCQSVPGSLVQIDAGSGQVFGVSGGDGIFSLLGGVWSQLPGALTHVTVGPAGVWGVNRHQSIYTWIGASWVQKEGGLMQIDAGGVQYLVGVNANHDAFCLNNTNSTWHWQGIEGRIRYYSCGLFGCWALNSTDDIHFRLGVTPGSCLGTGWQHVPGKLSVIEVGTDGSVYGVTRQGAAFRRDGITELNPTGISWTELQYKCYNFRHVTYDLNLVWLITTEGAIFRCDV